MNGNLVKIKFWKLFIVLVIQAYHTMYNMYEYSLYVEPLLYYRDIIIFKTFN